MSRRTGALKRAFVAWVPRGPLLALAGVVVLGAFGSKTFAAGKDYNTCFSESKVSADRQVAACTAIAEDRGEVPDLRVSAYFVRGLAYAQRNDIAHLIADMNEVIALDPTYVSAFTNRAIAWESKGDFDRAVADYTKAIALTPDDASRYADRALALNKKGEHDRAIADCDKAIDIDPANEMAYGVRGVVWEDKGDAARAQADYDKAESVRIDPIAPYLDRARSSIAERDRKRAKADCKRIANIDADKGRDCTRLIVEAFGEPGDGATDPNPASAQNAIGVEWQEKGDHTRAIAAFDEAIRLNPASSAFHFNRAKSWASKKNYARAIADLDEAVRRDPANAQAYRVRGMTMAQIGNSREAFADLDKAIAISSDDPKSYFERAVVWEAKDPDKAIADLDKAIALDPANADYRKERLSVQISKSRANGQPVLQSPSTATNQADVPVPAEQQAAKPTPPPTYAPPQLYAKQDNSAAIAWNLKSGLQAMQIDPKGAIDTFSFVIGLDPYNADAYYNRSIAEALVGNFDLAIGDCRRAVELDRKRAGTCWENLPGQQPTATQPNGDPATAKTLLERAQMRLSKYGVDGALLDFDKAISLDPDNADAYLGRSRARTLKGDRAGAAADCRRAVELDSTRSASCDEQAAGDEGKTEPSQDPEQPKAAAAAPKPQIVRPNLAATDDTLAAKSLETKDPRALQAILGGDAWLDMGKYDKAIGSYDLVIVLDPDNRFGYFGRGRARAATRDYGQAIADFDRVIQLAPNFAAAHFHRGIAKVTSGDVDGALGDCDRAATLDPKARDAHYCKGMAWHAKGDTGRAIAAYSVAIGIDPGHDASYYARGMARADRKDYAGAIADFDQALKLDPDNGDYAVARRAAVAATGENEAGTAEAAPDPAALVAALERGDAAYKKRKYDRAVAEYSRAVALAPNEPSTYSARARARLQKGDYDGALADLNRALDIDPSYIPAYHGRALILVKMHEPEKAIADFNRAIEMKPDYAPFYFGRGSTWYSMGDFDRAAADLDRALELDPKSEMARQGRKLAMAAKERASRSSQPAKSTKEALGLDSLSQGIKQASALVFFKQGRALQEKGDYDRAIAEFDQAIDLDPNNAAAYYGRAQSLTLKRNFEQALADYDKAVSLAPTEAKIHADRGLVRMSRHDIDGAYGDFQKALVLDPKNVSGYYGRGVIRKTRGDYDGAIADLSKGIELNPNFARLYEARSKAWEAKGNRKRAEADRNKALSLGAE
ncbi:MULTISPECIES: tetratricopeptide repeat protein [unclassified Mesorhizobium]|uniref:tetratricopeptide repeat protein n=1 Tax=unclassified Mesorhizobium TaxID=325217 RepID=UPI00112DAC05|nr:MULTISPECIES: tetratricopeptide repeat protein [unclassified Mesorhizobium]TPK96226.1 tetratricopeptide repeat protein [Mesorhizobium sp. B2-4-16]TPL62263.1 tetratricopeptide repeat protein [Mesorhizobium sp. B2-4-3]